MIIGLAALTTVQAQALYQQTITLNPGWNAIHFEVTPDVDDIEAVFAGLPIQSAWRFFPSEAGVVEITDPADGLMTVTGWFGYFPQPRPEAFLSNLFTITGNVAYLVNLESNTSTTVTISGRPILRPRIWRSDSFNLVGFTVDAANPPTFSEYFAASPAHAGQPIFKLNTAGLWEQVTAPATETIRAGTAYWVFTEGFSSFQGPVQVNLEVGEDLEYKSALDQQRLIFQNNSDFARQLTIRRVSGGDTVPMSFQITDSETGEQSFPNLPQSLSLDIEAGGDLFLSLSVRRGDFTQDRMEDIYEIDDGTGGRILFFVGATSLQPVVLATPKSGQGGKGKGKAKAKALSESYAGLWVGAALIDAVSESQTGGTIPTPTSSSLPLRIILHIDAAGQVRLLKDVIQMWADGTSQPVGDGSGFNIVETPGRFVLITDENLIPNFTGATVRGGAPVGIRYSTVGYYFEEQSLLFNELFDPAGSISVQIVTAPDDPTNPFKHKYHPDHDNKDAQFLNFRQEAFEITRDMELNFSLTDPEGRNPPGWGSTIVGGTFQEVLTGLHKNAIVVSGQFQLKRLSNVTTLNN